MKNHIEYSYRVQSLFFDYLHKGNDLDLLIDGLYDVESIISDNYKDSDCLGLWFKFHSNDTLCTNISDIKRDLSLPAYHTNKVLMVENMENVIGLYGDIKIYYS